MNVSIGKFVDGISAAYPSNIGLIFSEYDEKTDDYQLPFHLGRADFLIKKLGSTELDRHYWVSLTSLGQEFEKPHPKE